MAAIFSPPPINTFDFQQVNKSKIVELYIQYAG